MSATSITDKQFLELTGSKPEAWLLKHLMYWQEKATAKRDGKTWVVRTLEEFLNDDRCLWSSATIKRALAGLQKKNLISKFCAPHPFRGLLRSTWIRVAANKIKMILSKGSKRSGPKDQDEPFHITVSTSVSTDSKIHTGKPGSLSVKDTLDKLKKPKPKPKPKPVLQASELFDLMKSLQQEFYPENPIGDKTNYHLKLCKTIIKRFREEDLEDDMIRQGMDTVFENFASFRSYLETSCGKKNPPAYPAINHLTTVVSNMVSFLIWNANQEDIYEDFDDSDWAVGK